MFFAFFQFITNAKPLVLETFTKLFYECLHKIEVAAWWCDSIVVLLFKKGPKENINNNRSISILSAQIYKLFLRVITNSLADDMDN